MNDRYSTEGRPDQTSGSSSGETKIDSIVSSRYIVSKTNIKKAKGVGICFRPRSTYNSSVLVEAGRVE